MQYREEERFYTNSFQNNFNGLIEDLDYYDGETSSLSNESAIKNSVGTVYDLNLERGLSSYKYNTKLSEMLFNLKKFFTLESNEYINKNIAKIKPQLINLSSNLNDENAIEELNIELEKLISDK